MATRIGKVLSDAVDAVADFIDTSQVAARWTDDSALDGYTVGGLAGHLTSATSATLRYLDVPTDGEPLERGDYYAAVPSPVESPELHAGIRERGQGIADQGPQAVATMLRECANTLRVRLADRESDDLVAVMGGHLMRLDDYLETRVVEVVVHLDDLAHSVGSSEASLAEPAVRAAIDHLIAVAVSRHGTSSVLRALTRTERDVGNIFPVL